MQSSLILPATAALFFVVYISRHRSFWWRLAIWQKVSNASDQPRDNKNSGQTTQKSWKERSTGNDYRDSLPPDRRQYAEELQSIPAVGDEASEKTATGFTQSDIEVLSRFPDYARLSGVRLPEAYRDFDIRKALPRPYRPFRWAYHQTMCKVPYSVPNLFLIGRH